MTPTYVLIPKAAELTGYSIKAIERKIERRRWYATHRAKLAHIELINATARPMCQEGSAA
jgi:hypothetical protein